jgi:hypothetical protein
MRSRAKTLRNPSPLKGEAADRRIVADGLQQLGVGHLRIRPTLR